ncbi:MAG: glycosyltransferase 87 family protein [Candidatus Gastranaerophilales bacterium]|nr:glycosyltransferase 87 family protein [Candidatus Gastranaerophilales bacterium]
MEKREKVLVLSGIILVGFVIGVIYHYFLAYYIGFGTKYNSFLYPPYAAFCDFAGALPYLRDFMPYKQPTLWIVYFPFTYILIYPFVMIKKIFLSYSIFISIFLAYLTYMNIKNFSCENLTKLQNFQNIFILTIVSYPVLYILDKGNLDMLLFIFFGLFAYSFKKEKYLLSSVFLAMLNAMKPFTWLFLFLFLFKKKYKEFFLSIILTVLLTIGSFMAFKGGFFEQLSILFKSFAMFKIIYVYQNANDYGMGFGSSLFMPLKLVLCKLTAEPLVSLELFAKIYNFLCLPITIVTMFFVWKEESYWKKFTLLTCNFLLLPYIIFDYKFVFLFVPIWFFVNAEKKSRFDLIYTLLFALLFIPKNIIITLPYVSNTATTWFSLSIIINPIIMILLSLLIVYEQIRNKEGV